MAGGGEFRRNWKSPMFSDSTDRSCLIFGDTCFLPSSARPYETSALAVPLCSALKCKQCDHCGQPQIDYRSCRNRHCPKCHSRTRDEWLRDRSRELLPVPYCHVVFTLPHELAAVALQNPRTVYGILVHAAAESLIEMAADPKRLRARVGFLAVLHTWTQRLEHHPHIHCVVPAGGVSLDGQRWVSPRKAKFFLPVKPLSRLFRGKFLDYLEDAFAANRLEFHGRLRELNHPFCFQQLLSPLHTKEWVAYVKPPFGGPEHVLRYLARYTHRVAISNGRLQKLEGGRVHFVGGIRSTAMTSKKRRSMQSSLSADSSCM